VSTALYRRYRPETYADVIGQEHVTEPLMQALRTGRVNHAYLFSGPRGCGKTTSARILARCLNCEQGPTPTPCGQCESCVALSRGGAGSVDVIEIDAASHGGVDDARDLREKASYGPAQSRYKVYIIDEAHMVTPQGFNALLKIVEEPPEHVKFIFATTEPEKVIGTIRSRTHHYPFRLVPPARLQAYMETLCAAEGVAVAPGVLTFVTRAGGGSVRDSLSVLDQLIAGSGEEGLTYEGAAALLGFTDSELLDEVVGAFGAGDAATVFTAIDKVIETGLDPRRFVEDLLERLRDLIVVAAVPDGAAAVLRGLPQDQLDRMRTQAAAFGAGALSRAADVVNAGLTEMTGATAPRLQLELIAARVLLPGAAGEQGYAARLDRLERRLDVGGVPSAARPQTAGANAETRQPEPVPTPVAPVVADAGPSGRERTTPGGQAGGDALPHPAEPPAAPTREAAPPAGPAPAWGPNAPTSAPAQAWGPGVSGPGSPAASPEPEPTRAPGVAAAGTAPAAQPSTTPPPPARGPGGVDTAALRRAWPDVLGKVFTMRRTSWTLLSAHAQIADYDGATVTLAVGTPGLLATLSQGPHTEIVRQALIDVLGVDARVVGRVDDSGSGPAPDLAPPVSEPSAHAAEGGGPGAASSSGGSGGAAGEAPSPGHPAPSAPSSGSGSGSGSGSRPAAGPSDRLAEIGGAGAAAAGGRGQGQGGWATGGDWSSAPPPASSAPSWATEAVPTASPAATPAATATAVSAPPVPEEDLVSDDDEEVDGASEAGASVVERLLGGTVISDDQL
jgi:DNA polymerase-3 subunit gamma/tau